MLHRVLIAIVLLLLAVNPGAERAGAQEADPVHVQTSVRYDLTTDDGPVEVSWQVRVENNDPSTAPDGENGTVAFYSNLSIPVLQGASAMVAEDADGEELGVNIDESSNAPVTTARVDFARRIFYEEAYEFTVRYAIPETRADSVLVTPAYVFIPLVASGDEAIVEVVLPPEGEWESLLEPQDCEQEGTTFVCAGSESAYIAATAETSRPDAISTLEMSADLQAQTINISLSYFDGEEDVAAHLQRLIPAALPVIEEVFGVPYGGPSLVAIQQGGRQAVLGYEGITECASDACRITVSPVADDVTVIHELTHLWTGIFGERWLSEGFAQMYADEVASRLPADLVRSRPEQTVSEPVNLPLDHWGEVESVIGAGADQIAIESAGYYLSLRFVEILRSETGSSVLRSVNATIAEAGTPADSRRYLDVIEGVSGRKLDDLFATWVFAPEDSQLLALRREARDRLAELETRAATEGLPEGATAGIREDILAWRFDAALAKLDAIDADIETYNGLSEQLGRIAAEASSIGLTMPGSIADALDRWEFGNVRLALADARDALDAYRAARAEVEAPRSLWERFGLLGSDPEGRLDEAAADFAAGQFQASIDKSRSAAEIINDASTVALRRVLIVSGIFAAFGFIILAAVWASHLREREFVDR